MSEGANLIRREVLTEALNNLAEYEKSLVECQRERDEARAQVQQWLEWSESKGPGLDAYREQGATIEKLERERDEAREALRHTADDTVLVEQLTRERDEARALLESIWDEQDSHDRAYGLDKWTMDRIRACLGEDPPIAPVTDQTSTPDSPQWYCRICGKSHPGPVECGHPLCPQHEAEENDYEGPSR